MQFRLFSDADSIGQSIEDAAKRANVSTATIRNWIKTGYLVQISKGFVSSESLEKFMTEIAGIEKLGARANKLKKDEHDHLSLSDSIKEKLDSTGAEKVGDEYENALSNSHRNKEGIYYTPSTIIKDMLRDVKVNEETTFLDPCCGSGNFIIEAIKKGVLPENVFGFDSDTNAVEITKRRIFEETGFHSKNILLGDFLSEASKLKSQNQKFGLIFTNPPWGKKLPKKEKEQIARMYGGGKSLDTSSLFLFASLGLLKKDGFLGFLVQEAFFNISSYEDARKQLLKFNIVQLTDYGKPFKGLLTKAQAVIIQNTPSTELGNVICSLEKGTQYERTEVSFSQNPKTIFNFWVDEETANTIRKIYAVPHKTLARNAKWALGIVTGNNSKFCIDNLAEGHVPVYRGADITKKGLKEATSFIPNSFDKYQQVAPLEMYRADEKLIYKFISSKLVFFHDTKQRYVLNSANMLIPSDQIGITPSQLCDLLNSDVMNWLFHSLFSTYKILRGDLELLPIHTQYFSANPIFTEETYCNYLNLIKNQDGTCRVEESDYLQHLISSELRAA